jgi:uncharacterized protein YcbK (DUF882 family)
LLPAVAQFKVLTSAMTGFVAASSPAPMPVASVALTMEARAVEPIEVPLFDVNHLDSLTVAIGRDGGVTPEVFGQLEHMMRCKVTNNEKPIATFTLGMIADVSDRYRGKRVELVSGFRDKASESQTSPHRAGRAIDFRITGAEIGPLRDYLWRHFSRHSEVGVGWYPTDGFLHVDARPGLKSIAWTLLNGANQYHPAWSTAAMAPPATRPNRSVGL